MADRRDRLTALKKMLHERDRLRIHAQVIRIHHAARQMQSVKIFSLRRLQRNVDLHLFAPLRVIPTLHLASRRRNNFRLRSSILQRLLRLLKFALFKSIRYQDGNFPSLKGVSHNRSFMYYRTSISILSRWSLDAADRASVPQLANQFDLRILTERNDACGIVNLGLCLRVPLVPAIFSHPRIHRHQKFLPRKPQQHPTPLTSTEERAAIPVL